MPGTIPIGILGMTWFWMLGGTKRVYLSGSGNSELENCSIYILAISEWMKGRAGTVMHLGGRILNHYRASFASWHEKPMQFTVF